MVDLDQPPLGEVVWLGGEDLPHHLSDRLGTTLNRGRDGGKVLPQEGFDLIQTSLVQLSEEALEGGNKLSFKPCVMGGEGLTNMR